MRKTGPSRKLKEKWKIYLKDRETQKRKSHSINIGSSLMDQRIKGPIESKKLSNLSKPGR
jgi:hypothetical protein